ncbi:MAG: IS1 family transposase [Bacteroidetes bacterium]|nr:IS1 family transposase [Bacteroidota bacterium]
MSNLKINIPKKIIFCNIIISISSCNMNNIKFEMQNKKNSKNKKLSLRDSKSAPLPNDNSNSIAPMSENLLNQNEEVSEDSNDKHMVFVDDYSEVNLDDDNNFSVLLLKNSFGKFVYSPKQKIQMINKQCPKCHHNVCTKDEKAKGKQRYKCKGCKFRHTVIIKRTAATLAIKRQALQLYLVPDRKLLIFNILASNFYYQNRFSHFISTYFISDRCRLYFFYNIL